MSAVEREPALGDRVRICELTELQRKRDKVYVGTIGDVAQVGPIYVLVWIAQPDGTRVGLPFAREAIDVGVPYETA